MTVIYFPLFIILHGTLEPSISVESYVIMFPISVSYFHPATVIIIFLHGMEMVRIIRR